MYIKSVVLENIKAFEKCSLDFAPDGAHYPGWCVLTGDNGAGKTALLKSISLAVLGPFELRALLPSINGWVAARRRKASISVEIKPDLEVDKTAKGGYPNKGTLWAEIGFDVSINAKSSVFPENIYRKKRRGAENGPWANTSGWLLLAYGPFRRLYGSSPESSRMNAMGGRISHFTTLFKEDATLSEAEEWIKQLDHRRMYEGREEQVALSSLLRILNDDFLRHDIRVDRIDADGMWLSDVNGNVIALPDMSEGYRAALAMLVDIFRNMALTYGTEGLVAEDEEGTPYVTRPATVLIDEVDAHLHPEWQRRIGFWLKRRFPNVQFIVTTHSPLICQAADQGRIYALPQPGEGVPEQLSYDDYLKVISGKPDEILLTPAFGLRNTRSELAIEKRKRRADLKAKERGLGLTDSEEIEFEQLELFA